MVFSSRADRHRQQIRKFLFRNAPCPTSGRGADARRELRAGHGYLFRYSAASDVVPPSLEL